MALWWRNKKKKDHERPDRNDDEQTEEIEYCEGCGFKFESDRDKCEDCWQYTVCHRGQCGFCKHCREYKN